MRDQEGWGDLPPWEPSPETTPVEDASGLTATVSVSWKKQVRQFEMAEVFISVSGIKPTTSPAELDEMADQQAALAVNAIIGSLKERMRTVVANVSGE